MEAPKRGAASMDRHRVRTAARHAAALPDTSENPAISSISAERLGYPTQKPEALLERIISAC